jgi:hypothetical protein
LSRSSLDLQYLFEVAVRPDPGTLSEQLVVDIYAICGIQSFPLAINVKNGFDECSFHPVFMGCLFGFFTTGLHVGTPVVHFATLAAVFFSTGTEISHAAFTAGTTTLDTTGPALALDLTVSKVFK